ncbi:hypothetical protein EDC04DRAFT_2724073, partial [Pisolithus marmoratus]
IAYVEENLKIHSGPPDPSESKSRDTSAQDEFTLSERWNIWKRAVSAERVIASIPMLTTILEANLALESIEEIGKAKRQSTVRTSSISLTWKSCKVRGCTPLPVQEC